MWIDGKSFLIPCNAHVKIMKLKSRNIISNIDEKEEHQKQHKMWKQSLNLVIDCTEK